ncbi:MAG TPA: 50S ribosomal protein L15 [Alphaproteobacteria bacterium]
MRLNQIQDKGGARRDRVRVGRGSASGKGRTAGRGMKGQKSRSGVALGGFEGGQMPLNRRLPKRGFRNTFSKTYATVNVGRLQQAVDAGKLDPKAPIDAGVLKAAGVIRRPLDGVRLLGKGELKAKLTIEVAGASKGAVAAVEKAGGKVVITEPVEAPEAAEAAAGDGD